MTITIVVPRHRDGPAIPGWYRGAYVCLDRNADVCAPIGIHLILRAFDRWRRHRWAAERLGVRLGTYDLEEGGYYRDGRWTLAFWRVWQRRVDAARRAGLNAADRSYKAGLRDGEEQFIERIRAQMDQDRVARAG